ncbi:uncharacterized protein EI97DRAFT_497526 [Westerdykella ornata]|uniref:C2H2-type domain-containing protein n=1 Tax=Westerdykella ornata TaxID=318751 RepID=A0A6A6JXG9_WESOR|nr:uncharacterized protein EI97DRAFT_497526 [Westerdykella ornata]KAF2280763.1 hypothetical protein EI97DRAFT_497526 [Westerdykella ornata]
MSGWRTVVPAPAVSTSIRAWGSGKQGENVTVHSTVFCVEQTMAKGGYFDAVSDLTTVNIVDDCEAGSPDISTSVSRQFVRPSGAKTVPHHKEEGGGDVRIIRIIITSREKARREEKRDPREGAQRETQPLIARVAPHHLPPLLLLSLLLPTTSFSFLPITITTYGVPNPLRAPLLDLGSRKASNSAPLGPLGQASEDLARPDEGPLSCVVAERAQPLVIAHQPSSDNLPHTFSTPAPPQHHTFSSSACCYLTPYPLGDTTHTLLHVLCTFCLRAFHRENHDKARLGLPASAPSLICPAAPPRAPPHLHPVINSTVHPLALLATRNIGSSHVVLVGTTSREVVLSPAEPSQPSTRAITPTHSGAFSAPNRPDTPGSIGASRNHSNGAAFGTHLTKSPRGLSPRHSPQPLAEATTPADERREKSRQPTPNPGVAVLQSLLDAQATARPKDGPPEPAQMSAALEKAAKSLVIPDQLGTDTMHTSPVSLSSFGSNDNLTTAATATAPEPTAGPMPMQEGAPQLQQQQHHQHIVPNMGDVASNRSFTFPGPAPPEHDPRAPSRQMSLPGGYQNSPKSPGKRHKCPYCSTDFTRHHNLKSHLLTHSQEKPYECSTCQQRFRRLHDLKRHTKLHTGERPHTCEKCGRKFARGDALARHSKGQGGCAGRRSSMGEDFSEHKVDETMDGIMYHERDGEGDEDDDGTGRRVGEPPRKRQNTGNSMQGPYHQQHSSTYPPIARGPSSHNLHPMYSSGPVGPSRDQATDVSPKIAPASLNNLPYHANSQPNVFSQGGMTESPKPLSPGQADQHRLGAHDGTLPSHPRSPNMGQQMHQQNFSRRTGRGSSPRALGPPQQHAGGPQLPPLHGMAQGGKGSGPSMLHQQIPGPGTESQPGSMSSHGGSGSSMREIMGRPTVDVWQTVREMENRMARMEEEHQKRIQSLQEEVTKLRAQLAHQHVEASAPHQENNH